MNRIFLALLVFPAVACPGAAILDDDDASPDDDDGPAAPPESSGALEAAAAWGDVVLGSGLEVGRCLAVQNDGAVALGLCDVGSGRGFSLVNGTLRDGDGQCLDGSGDAVRMEPCEEGTDTHQRWVHAMDGRLYGLRSGASSWLCLTAIDRTQFPILGPCDEEPETRWAVGMHRRPITASQIAEAEGVFPNERLDPVVPVGGGAAVVALSPSGVPVIVAGRVGEGRAVGFGARSALNSADDASPWADLWRDVLDWAGDSNDPIVGVLEGSPGEAWMDRLGYTVIPDLDPAAGLSGIDVLLVGDRDEGGWDDEGMENIHTFLREGGGVVAGRNSYPAGRFTAVDAAREFRTVAAVAPAGIAWTGSDSGGAASDEPLSSPGDDPELLNLTVALETAGRAEQGLEELDFATWQSLRLQSRAGGTASTIVPNHSRLHAATDALREELGGLEISPEEPFEASSGQLPDLVMRGDYVLTGSTPPGSGRVHESAASHPGLLPPETDTESTTVVFDAASPLRRLRVETGWYAPAGTTVTIEVPALARGLGLQLRIGDAVGDTMPFVDADDPGPSARFTRPWSAARLDRAEVVVESSFGGPISIDVPERGGSTEVTLTLHGVVPMPHWRAGETTEAEWEAAIDAGAPRASLQSDRVILGGPSTVLGELQDPQATLDRFDAAVVAHETFVALIPGERRSEEALPHRIGTDVRLGEALETSRPMVLSEDWARGLYVPELQLGNPGLFEVLRALGRRYRQDAWSPPEWREVFATLAALYAFEEALELPMDEAWQGTLTSATRQTRRAEFLAGDGSGWSADLETSLEPLLLVKDEWGWTPILEVLGDLRRLPSDERPDGDEAMLQAWIVGLTEATGTDVSGLLQAFRFPVTEETRDAVENAAPWPAWPWVEPPPEEEEEEEEEPPLGTPRR